MVPLDALLDTEEYFSKGNIYVIETWKLEGTKGHPRHRVLPSTGRGRGGGRSRFGFDER